MNEKAIFGLFLYEMRERQKLKSESYDKPAKVESKEEEE